MSAYEELRQRLEGQPSRWMVTGAAGFIGSHLVQHLLQLGQEVVGIDNFETGFRYNLDDVRLIVGENNWRRFTFFDADICNLEACRQAMAGVTIVLHQAALGSVPRSIADPLRSNRANVEGFSMFSWQPETWTCSE